MKNRNRSVVLSAAVLALVLHLVASAAVRIALSTDDTTLNVVVSNNVIYVDSLLNPAQNWNWVSSPAAVPLPGANSVYIGNTAYTPTWTFCEATEENSNGHQVIFRFTSTTPGLELKSIWQARPGPGPVENRVTIQNKAGVDVAYRSTIAAAAVTIRADRAVNLYRFDKTAVGRGQVYNDRIGANASFSTTTAMIPFIMLDAGAVHGLYIGYEWELGGFTVTSGSDPLAITASAYPLTENVTQTNNEVFVIPSVYYGAYKGDIDDGSNKFKKWFWNHKITRSLHDHADEPWTEVCAGDGGPGPKGSTSQSYYDDLAATGVECVKCDFWDGSGDCWYSNRDWMYHASVWPNGFDFATKARKAGLKVALYMGSTYNDNDLTRISGRDAELSAVLTRYDQGWFDMWRTDQFTAPFEPMPQNYAGVANFLYIQDHLIANRPGYRYENCCNGGKYKGFAICRRMTFCTMNDADQDANITRTTYYSDSFAINPVQLKSDLGPATTAFNLRTDMLGAILTWEAHNPLYQQHISLYKTRQRPILRGADVYHILPMADGINWDGLEYFNTELKKGSVFLFKPSHNAVDGDAKVIKLRGLDPDTLYALTLQDRTALNCIMTGAQLMKDGIAVTGMTGDNASEIIWIEAFQVHVTATAKVVTGLAPLSVPFSANGRSLKDRALTYSWTFGDGGKSAEKNPCHLYAKAGRYVAEVAVSDGQGNVDTTRIPITVIGGSRRMCITFSGYGKPETLTNFPALLVFGTNLAASGFSYAHMASAKGWDLVLANSNGTQELNYEVERWNTNGDSFVWVQVPELKGTNTCIGAYWGSTNLASTPAPCTTWASVWNDGYAGVWHMTGEGSLSGADSSANNNQGTPGSKATAAAGRIDGGGAFHGTVDDCIGLATLNPLPGGTGTVSVWANWNTDSLAKNNYALTKGQDFGAASWGINFIPSATNCCVYLLYGDAQWVGPATIQSTWGAWHLVTAVMRPNAQEIYVDGVRLTTGSKTTITPAASVSLFIGKTARADPYAYAFNGTLDEVRIATAQRSADWVWAEWMNVASNAVFNRYGQAQ